MRFGEREFLILLAVNLAVAAGYLLCQLAFGEREPSRSCLLKAGMMVLCPLVGPAFLALGWVFSQALYWREAQLADVVFSKERIKPQMAAQEERESNLAPVEEAVAVMDQDSLREMMMNVVRGDVRASASAIATALESGDPEVSHYAATALQSLLDEFRATVQGNCDQLAAEPDTPEGQTARTQLMVETVERVAGFLWHRLLTQGEQREYAALLDEFCEGLLEIAPYRLTVSHYQAVSTQLLEAGEYESCKKWCLRAYRTFPDRLEPYSCLLRLYFTLGDREKFFQVMVELRSSDIAIDRATLELMRVFQ